MDNIDSKTIWLDRGFSETEAETIALFYKERYGIHPSNLKDKRIFSASHGYRYTLDSEMWAAGFSSRLDMARAILQGTRDDLLYP